MIETVLLLTSLQSRSYPLLATSYFNNVLIWYIMLLFFITGSIIAAVLLYTYSVEPKDWKHESIVTGSESPGKFKNLTDTVKVMPVNYSDSAAIKKFIQNIFFEKVRIIRGLSDQDIQTLHMKNRQHLESLIQDREIIDFIWDFTQKEEKGTLLSFLNKNDTVRREKYIKDLDAILDRMEAWET